MRRLAIVVVAVACRGESRQPAAPSCAAMADHAAALFGTSEPAHTRAVRDALAARCEADAWSDTMRTCISKTTSLEAPRQCRGHLDAKAGMALDEALLAIERADPELNAACRAYESALAACTALPAEQRTELREKLAAARRDQRDPERLRDMCERARAALLEPCGPGSNTP